MKQIIKEEGGAEEVEHTFWAMSGREVMWPTPPLSGPVVVTKEQQIVVEWVLCNEEG